MEIGTLFSLTVQGAPSKSHTHSVRARSQPDGVQRASRAMSLVQVGELSAARQALEGAALAPGSLATSRILTDSERRPPVPREAVSPFQLEPELICLRKARQGAAPGPSGMTSDHLFPLLSHERDSELLVQVGSLWATGDVPDVIIEAIGWAG